MTDTSPTSTEQCSHGHDGFCWDDAAPEQRVTFELLHRHAYAWAADHLPDGDPEQYAADYAGEHYALPGDEWVSHPSYAERWERQQATLPTN